MISDRVKTDINLFEQQGIIVRGFLKAVLENDLFSAMKMATSDERVALPFIAQYIVKELPVESWGSREKVREWKGTGVAMLAREFATKKHEGMMYGDYPYTKHLADVFALLTLAGVTDKVALDTAWLHDTIEDTDTTIEEIRDLFGMPVAARVALLTDKLLDSPRRIRHEATYNLIKDDAVATTVKWADRLANIIASVGDPAAWKKLKMYKKEHPAFVEVLDVKFHVAMFDDAIELFKTRAEFLLK